MYTCPNCSEVLGDDVRECPFCKHVISDTEYKHIENEKESIHEQAVQAAIDEYGRRLRIGVISVLVYFIVIISGCISLVLLGVNQELIFLLSVAVMIVYLLIAYKLRIDFCPYCEEMMGKDIFFRKHCPRCGGQLR